VIVCLQRDKNGLGLGLEAIGEPPLTRTVVDELLDGTVAKLCGRIFLGDILVEVRERERERERAPPLASITH
jgi:hypothetical protein